MHFILMTKLRRGTWARHGIVFELEERNMVNHSVEKHLSADIHIKLIATE